MSYYTEFKDILNNAIKTNSENLSLLSQLNSNIQTNSTKSSTGVGTYSDSAIVTVIREYILSLRALKYNINNNVSDTIIDNTIVQLQGIIPTPPSISQINRALNIFYETHERNINTFTLAQSYLVKNFGAALDKTISDSIIKSFIAT